MEGYTPVFRTGEQAYQEYSETNPLTSLYEDFMSHQTIYGFIHCCDVEAEESSIQLAKSINPDLYDKFIIANKNKKPLGYKNFSMKNFDYNLLDSRHIMMSVALWSWLPEPIERVVEIGGGFGNWLRLNYEVGRFQKWTIIDIPHVSALQAWYLQQYPIPSEKYEVVNSLDYKKQGVQGDLVIGAHSLSEVAFPIFFDYFNTIISKTKYFFYAYHKFSPNPDIIQKKLDIIHSQFQLVNSITTESGNVVNALYSHI